MLSGLVVTYGCAWVSGEGSAIGMSGWGWAIAAGLVGTTANLFETAAIQDGRTSIVKAITDLAPVVILLIELIWLRDKVLSIRQMVGMILSIIGVVLIAI